MSGTSSDRHCGACRRSGPGSPAQLATLPQAAAANGDGECAMVRTGCRSGGRARSHAHHATVRGRHRRVERPRRWIAGSVRDAVAIAPPDRSCRGVRAGGPCPPTAARSPRSRTGCRGGVPRVRDERDIGGARRTIAQLLHQRSHDSLAQAQPRGCCVSIRAALSTSTSVAASRPETAPRRSTRCPQVHGVATMPGRRGKPSRLVVLGLPPRRR